MFIDTNKRIKKVAVCVTGHLRTFIEPGVHSALAKNIAHDGVSVDTYIVGHTGTYAYTPRAKNGLSYLMAHTSALENANSPEILKAINFPGLNTRKAFITKGDCAALEASWHADGVTDRICHENGNFLQVMWIDKCIHMIRETGINYDLVLRTRPDVGVFQPVNYSALPWNRVGCMRKDDVPLCRADWFFAMSMPTVHTWWDRIASVYVDIEKSGRFGSPIIEYTIFNDSPTFQTLFPAAIVRSPTEVECFRLMDVGLRSACEGLAAGGYFGNQVH